MPGRRTGEASADDVQPPTQATQAHAGASLARFFGAAKFVALSSLLENKPLSSLLVNKKQNLPFFLVYKKNEAP